MLEWVVSLVKAFPFIFFLDWGFYFSFSLSLPSFLLSPSLVLFLLPFSFSHLYAMYLTAQEHMSSVLLLSACSSFCLCHVSHRPGVHMPSLSLSSCSSLLHVGSISPVTSSIFILFLLPWFSCTTHLTQHSFLFVYPYGLYYSTYRISTLLLPE